MDMTFMMQVIAAVIVALAAFSAFAFAAYTAHKLQKHEYKSDTELPLWVYPCLAIVPIFVAVGFIVTP